MAKYKSISTGLVVEVGENTSLPLSMYEPIVEKKDEAPKPKRANRKTTKPE